VVRAFTESNESRWYRWHPVTVASVYLTMLGRAPEPDAVRYWEQRFTDGGTLGSLIKFCYHRMPGTQLTAVELDANVIAFRDTFQLPADGPRLQVLQADGAEYIEQADKGIDVLLVDAFDKTGFAPSLANRAFFEHAFAKLAGNGVLVINLAGEKETYAGLIGEAMHVFDDQVIVISVPDDGNHVLYAFKEHWFEPRWRWLHNYAKELRAKFGLDFPAFVQKMERSTKLGLARREALRRR
jgi:spermidine synthase